jgi:hypothetical protein
MLRRPSSWPSHNLNTARHPSNMLKNRTALFALCLALFVAAVCGGGLRTNAVAASHGTSTEPTLFSTSTGTLAPRSAPRTVRVRLMEVETNADVVDWPYPGSEIIIKAGATVLSQKTDGEGVVVFDAIPCGQQIVITRKGTDGGEDGVFHRRLSCARRQVDLGIIERAFGGTYTLRQRKPQRMGYDAARNVWRNAEGKIISMRTFRRIMAQRQ